MALIRWEPARELGTIQTEVNRLFNSFFDTPTGAARTAAPSRRWIPAIDVVETESDFVLRADLPGVSESEVSIEVDENVLSISGERKSEHAERTAGYYRVERSSGAFRRSLTLPEGVDAEAIGATFANGVLTVTVPKPEIRQPRKVQISVGAGSGQPQAIEADEARAVSETSEAPAVPETAEAPAAA